MHTADMAGGPPRCWRAGRRDERIAHRKNWKLEKLPKRIAHRKNWKLEKLPKPKGGRKGNLLRVRDMEVRGNGITKNEKRGRRADNGAKEEAVVKREGAMGRKASNVKQ
jgi:hypothetical protein